MDTTELREQIARKTLPIASVITRANEIRLKLDEEALAFKKRMERPQAYLTALENVIHEWLNAEGLQNAKGSDGSIAFKTKRVSVSVADWDTVWAHIVAHSAWQYLNHSVNKTEVQAYVEEKGTPPPGVNYTVTEVVQFRQPRKKGGSDADEAEA
jgi:hypothetical protein